MGIAFTCENGQGDGEYLMRCNPVFKREMKERQKRLG